MDSCSVDFADYYSFLDNNKMKALIYVVHDFMKVDKEFFISVAGKRKINKIKALINFINAPWMHLLCDLPENLILLSNTTLITMSVSI